MGTQSRPGKGSWGALAPGRHQAAPASEDPVTLRDGRVLRQDPQLSHDSRGRQSMGRAGGREAVLDTHP